MSNNEFLSEKQAIEIIPVGLRALQMDRIRGDLGVPFLKVGAGKKGKVMYRRSDLDAWLESRRVVPERVEVAPRRRGRPTKAEQLARLAAQRGAA